MDRPMLIQILSEQSPQNLQFVTEALVLLSVGAVLLLLWPGNPDAKRLKSRMQLAAGASVPDRDGTDTPDDRRRKLVKDTLRELEAQEKARARRNARPTLTGRMRQAGLPWSRYTYWVISVLVGLLTYLVTLSLAQIGLLPALGFGMTAGLLLPHLYVSHRRISRFNRFGLEFPNALDIIVRGVTAGLPLVDCLKIVATEAQEPVATEFRGIIHDQTMGVPLDEAVERLAKRIPLSEASFFAIVIAIQSRTGGSLSEALGNLSKVLRDRKNLKGKVTALSAEAKSSAGIIGAMPLVVALILYFTAPDYVMLLFTTTTGKIVVGGSVLWMLVGTLMMRKMINFDF